jgi:hypothetical protein
VDKKITIENTLNSKELNKKYQFLPINTKYFKDLELEILELFDDLDNFLDVWLIKSENYQELNTILPKFKERFRQFIFILIHLIIIVAMSLFIKTSFSIQVGLP